MKKRWVFHLINLCGAARAAILLAVGKFVATLGTNELILLFGRDCRTTLPVADQPREREHMRNRAWVGLCAEPELDPVVFFFGDHRFMAALMPLPRSFGIFEPAII